jgi:hypothetical protein
VHELREHERVQLGTACRDGGFARPTWIDGDGDTPKIVSNIKRQQYCNAAMQTGSTKESNGHLN